MDDRIFLNASKSHKNLLKNYEESKKLYKEVIDYANKVLPALSDLLQKQKQRAQALRSEMELLSAEVPDDLSDVRNKLAKSIDTFNSTLNESLDKTIKVDMIINDVQKRVSDKKIQDVLNEKKSSSSSFWGSLFG